MLPVLAAGGPGTWVAVTSHTHKRFRERLVKRTRLISMMFLGLLLVGGLSCSTDQGPTGPAPSITEPQFGRSKQGGWGIPGGGRSPFLSCSQIGSEGGGGTIGAAGGTIRAGKNSLVIPAGALSRSTQITMTVVTDSIRVAQLLPEGLVFAVGKPAKLTLDYGDCTHVLLPKKIAYTNNLLQVIQLLLSVDNLLQKSVSAPLEHFSRYAVAY